MRKFSRTDLLILLAMGLLIAGVYWPQWLFGQTAVESPHMRDITHQWYPYYMEVAKGYESGLFPLWDTHRLFGSSLIINTYISVLYFVQVFFLVFFDYLVAVPLSVGLHSWLAAGLMYGLLRRMGVSALTGFMVALSYVLSGLFFFTNNHPGHLFTFSWLPLVYWSCLNIMKQPRLRDFLLLGISAWLMALSGEIEAFIYHMMGLLLFVVLFGKGAGAKQRFRSAVIVISAVIVCGLLIQPYFLTVSEMLSHSIRNPEFGLDIHFIHFFGDQYYLMIPLFFFPFDFLKEYFPFDMYNHGLSPLYQGMIIISMLFLAVRYVGRDREIRRLCYWLLAVVVSGIVLVIPSFQPWLEHLPVLGSMENHFKWIEVIQFSILILAAKGLDAFRDEMRRGIPWPAIVLALLWGAGIILTLPWSAGGIERVVLAGFLIVVGVLLVVARSRGRAPVPGQVSWVLVLVFLVDVYPLALRCVPRNSTEIFEAPARFVQRLKPESASHRFRFLVLEGSYHADLSPDITGLLKPQTNADTITTYFRVPIFRSFQLAYKAFPSVLQQGPEGRHYYDPTQMHNPRFLNIKSMQLLNLAAVRYLISRNYSLKFASPYYLLKPEALPSPPEILRGKKFAPGHKPGARPACPACLCVARRQADAGREVVLTFPSRLRFQGTVYKDSSLELVCEGGCPKDAGFLQVIVKGTQENGSRLLLSRTAAGSAGAPCSGRPLKLDLSGLEQGEYDYRLSALPWQRSDARAVIRDLRMVRPEAPLQELPAVPGLYINQQALPRAYVVHRAEVIDKEAALLDKLISPERFDPRESVLLSRPDPGLLLVNRVRRQRPWPVRERVRILSHDTAKAGMRVNMKDPGYLVLSDSYYPGWRVWVNGRERKMLRANYAFRAVFLDSGQNLVIFRYLPASFRIGWWTMIAGLAMAGIALIVHAKAQRSRR